MTWRLAGSCVVAFVRGFDDGEAGGLAMPDGVRRVPLLPSVVIAASYDASPVGPYRELAVAVPAHVGARPGLCTVLSLVDSLDARLAYRQQWSLPTELATLHWSSPLLLLSSSTHEVEFTCVELGLDLSASASSGGVRLPFIAPARSLQRRVEGPVVLPRWARGGARLARADIHIADPSSPWMRLSGPHAGAIVSSLRVAARPARQPAALLSSFSLRPSVSR